MATVDPTPYWAHYGENVWAAVRGYLDEVTDTATAPVVKKYTGVLAAADIEDFTRSTTFMIMQSLRLDRGSGHKCTLMTSDGRRITAGGRDGR